MKKVSKRRTVSLSQAKYKIRHEPGCVFELYAVQVSNGGLDVVVNMPKSGGRLAAHFPGKRVNWEKAFAALQPDLVRLIDSWHKRMPEFVETKAKGKPKRKTRSRP